MSCSPNVTITVMDPNFECKICYEILVDPQKLQPCGHIICLSCYKKWENCQSQRFRQTTCPECRSSIQAHETDEDLTQKLVESYHDLYEQRLDEIKVESQQQQIQQQQQQQIQQQQQREEEEENQRQQNGVRGRSLPEDWSFMSICRGLIITTLSFLLSFPISYFDLNKFVLIFFLFICCLLWDSERRLMILYFIDRHLKRFFMCGTNRISVADVILFFITFFFFVLVPLLVKMATLLSKF